MLLPSSPDFAVSVRSSSSLRLPESARSLLRRAFWASRALYRTSADSTAFVYSLFETHAAVPSGTRANAVILRKVILRKVLRIGGLLGSRKPGELPASACTAAIHYGKRRRGGEELSRKPSG